jgi:putative membrane protein
MMALFVVLIVWVVRAVVGVTNPGETAPRDPVDRAREILAERYARGEISSDEYRERSDELK